MTGESETKNVTYPIIVTYPNENVTYIECPNCGEDLRTVYGRNRWVEWFSGNCDICGYRFRLKQSDFQYVQPDSPFFELIYHYHPEKEAEKQKKEKEWKEEQRKAKLEEKYENMRGRQLKSHEVQTLKKVVLEEDN